MFTVEPVRFGVFLAGILAVFTASTVSRADVCSSTWIPGFGVPGLDSSGRAIVGFDGPNGRELYVGGAFSNAGSAAAQRVARWNGTEWLSLGSGVNGTVAAMIVFDDGNGPGVFVGGEFTMAGGMAVGYVAKWDGDEWINLAGGLNNHVRSLGIFDAGNGPALYAGGIFTQTGTGVPAKGIAKWNGSSWSSVGTGTGGANASINAMEVFDSGSGPALHVGGFFTSINGVPASNIARFDGESWSALGQGTSGELWALTVHDDGTGSALYVGGTFAFAGGMPASRVARWDGKSWSPLGSGVSGGLLGVQALVSFSPDDPAGQSGISRLFITGTMTSANGQSVSNIVEVAGGQWNSLNGGLAGGPLPAGLGATIFDMGDGHRLYVTGTFHLAGGSTAMRIAELNIDASPSIVEFREDDVALSAGDTLELTVVADGPGKLSYQWRRDGVALLDGNGISGAESPTLTILDVSPADEGEYDVLVMNECGSALSVAVLLTVTGDVVGDLNNDGVVDVFDLLLLLGDWGLCGDSEECRSDLNGDGVVNVFDLLILLSNWG